MAQVQGMTLMPFLYPCLSSLCSPSIHITNSSKASRLLRRLHSQVQRQINDARRATAFAPVPPPSSTHLNPTPDDYSRSLFADKCTITINAGSGGNGCVPFLREAHVPDGPANGGDGGNGGSVWIQAVPGHTSLHKLGRQGTVKAGRGQGGQGKSQ